MGTDEGSGERPPPTLPMSGEPEPIAAEPEAIAAGPASGADPDHLPLAHLGGPSEDHPPVNSVRVWWFVGVTAAIVVVGLVVGILVFNHSAPTRRHGALTAGEAAVQFVNAVNAGSERRAAAISCDMFVDDAKAIARSGQDPAFRIRLRRVESVADGDATAVVLPQLTVGGQHQTNTTRLSVLRQDGLWLMCGRV